MYYADVLCTDQGYSQVSCSLFSLCCKRAQTIYSWHDAAENARREAVGSCSRALQIEADGRTCGRELRAEEEACVRSGC